MRKSRLIIIVFIFLALSLGIAEGVPVQVLTSIIKLEHGDASTVILREEQDLLTYVSKSGKTDPYKTIKEKMQGKGWVYQGESHASLLFEKKGEVFGTDVREYWKKYVVWSAPEERASTDERELEIH
ncbi:hypothetical protein [Rossellomorea sp. NPDC077527]|uniref:hypothetical protein n=1 Tax=Rossellomorea sp. NPDC077527 TaxID=3364510 RepID=UPI0037CBE05C